MSDLSTKPVAQPLTEPEQVLEYLKTSPIRTVEVKRIQTGLVNFVYRLFLSQPLGKVQQMTAILKYSAPYIASEPQVLFSSDRQIFEARALNHIPWRQFRYQGMPLAEVTLPEVYLEDRENHISVIQDCTPRTEKYQEEYSFRIFGEHVAESETKYQTARVIGCMLGTFLAQLHAWGRSQESHEQAVELFEANNQATKLAVAITLTDFFNNISKIGYQISQEQQVALELRIQHLDHEVEIQRDTVIMGDFWPGNVLMSFDKANNLSNISVIDWEFVAIGPTFMDVGFFIGELFALHYFESKDSTDVTILDSFIQAYQNISGPLDFEQTLGFAGAAIIMSLPPLIDSKRSSATKTTAGQCVKHALNFMTGPGFTNDKSREHDSFTSLSQIMRDCRSERK